MSALAVILAFSGVALHRADPPAPLKWEYRLLRASELGRIAQAGDPDGQRGGEVSFAFNKLGDEGWEFVAILPADQTGAAGGGVPAAGLRPGPPQLYENLWTGTAKGRDSINVNDSEFTRLRERMTEWGVTPPKDGVLTKELFVKLMGDRKFGPTYCFKRPKR